MGRGPPIPLPKERQQVYARRLRRRRSAHVMELPLFRRELKAVCFAAVCLGTLADDMLRLIEIRIAAIWTRGHQVVTEKLMPARVRKKSESLAELRQLIAGNTITDGVFRAKVSTLLLPKSSNALQAQAADVRKVLSRNARRIRPILQLLIKLDLLGDGAGGYGLSYLIGIYKDVADNFYMHGAPAWA